MGTAVNTSLAHGLTILLACIVALSFGLHTIEQKHAHYGLFHPDTHEKNSFGFLSEYTHGTEKKSFVYVLAGVITASLYVVWNNILLLLTLLYRDFFKRIPKERFYMRRFDYLLRLFCSGVLNPKYF
jgi:hypothetical protein